jgi:hypothetical protein
MLARIKNFASLLFIASLSVFSAVPAVFAAGRIPLEQPLSERLGIVHVDGAYHFTSQPFLIEGAKQVRATGTRVIKLWLSPKKYTPNSSWPAAPNLIDVIQTPYFQEVFNMDFAAYILEAHWNTADHAGWMDGMDQSEMTEVENNYFLAANWLLATFKNTGKIFILQNWETENYVLPTMRAHMGNLSQQAVQVGTEGFLDYLKARHRGVERAQRENHGSSAKVCSAVETVWISSNPGEFRIIDNLDRVHADIISYSSWECGSSALLLSENLNALKKKLNGRPFYVGELFLTEDNYTTSPAAHLPSVIAHIDTALEAGAGYVLLWQLYDNEGGGLGLIRKDGSKMPLYQVLQEIMPLTSVPKDLFINKEFFTKLGKVSAWLGNDVKRGYARGAVIHLKSDFKPEKKLGFTIHKNGATVSSANKGDTVSIWLADPVPDIIIK